MSARQLIVLTLAAIAAFAALFLMSSLSGRRAQPIAGEQAREHVIERGAA